MANTQRAQGLGIGIGIKVIAVAVTPLIILGFVSLFNLNSISDLFKSTSDIRDQLSEKINAVGQANADIQGDIMDIILATNAVMESHQASILAEDPEGAAKTLAAREKIRINLGQFSSHLEALKVALLAGGFISESQTNTTTGIQKLIGINPGDLSLLFTAVFERELEGRKMDLVLGMCFYSGVATLSFLGGLAAVISPLGTGLFIGGLLLHAHQNK